VGRGEGADQGKKEKGESKLVGCETELGGGGVRLKRGIKTEERPLRVRRLRANALVRKGKHRWQRQEMERNVGGRGECGGGRLT